MRRLLLESRIDRFDVSEELFPRPEDRMRTTVALYPFLWDLEVKERFFRAIDTPGACRNLGVSRDVQFAFCP